MLTSLIALARPKHWIKNIFVLAPILFIAGSWRELSPPPVLLTIFAFCLISSFVYVMNDMADAEKDRLDPKKSSRPIANGDIGAGPAVFFGFFLLAVSLGLAYSVSLHVMLYVIVYAILNVAYTFHLKHFPIIDVSCISIGFVLRAMSGATAATISQPSLTYLYFTIFFFCMSLGFAKRLSEIRRLGENADHCRKALKGLSISWLSQQTSNAMWASISMLALFSIDSNYIVRTTFLLLFLSSLRLSQMIEMGKGEDARKDILGDKMVLTMALFIFILLTINSLGVISL